MGKREEKTKMISNQNTIPLKAQRNEAVRQNVNDKRTREIEISFSEDTKKCSNAVRSAI